MPRRIAKRRYNATIVDEGDNSSSGGCPALTSMLQSFSVVDLANVSIVNDNAQLPSYELLTKCSLANKATTSTASSETRRRSRERLEQILNSSLTCLASTFTENDDFDMNPWDLDPFTDKRWGEKRPQIEQADESLSQPTTTSRREGSPVRPNRRKSSFDALEVQPVVGHERKDTTSHAPKYPNRRESEVVIIRHGGMSIPPPPPPPKEEDVFDVVSSPTSIMDIGRIR